MTDLKNNLEEFLIEHKNVRTTFNKNRDYTSLEKMIEYSKQLEQELTQSKKLTYKYYGESEQLKIDKKYLEQELQKTREQLNKCELALNNYAICDDIGVAARRYFKDKQGE